MPISFGYRKLWKSIENGKLERDHRSGKLSNIVAELGNAVFPLMFQDRESVWKYIGTGFFISPNGVFVTSNHVLKSYGSLVGKDNQVIAAMPFLSTDEFLIMPVIVYVGSETSDLAVGVVKTNHLELDNGTKNEFLAITTAVPLVPQRVICFSFTNMETDLTGAKQELRVAPKLFPGRVGETIFGDGTGNLEALPLVDTTIKASQGNSGSPVAGKDGSVFGVYSAGFEGHDFSFISKIERILDFNIVPRANLTKGERNSVPIRDLIANGEIVVTG